ncbi:hypothetical protein CEXT_239241 [Caerostris extrusa]|uniref:Uncharacterized protein n=1 Tax=Caerostris extrusa TaxID=172846 RepID=A0AAV4UR52_CAEEX|nr:hypothetical protein CEXT_239241 [Caerostris extrusa]
MTPDGSYSKILENDDWKCYICYPDPDKNCLIVRREDIINLHPLVVSEEHLDQSIHQANSDESSVSEEHLDQSIHQANSDESSVSEEHLDQSIHQANSDESSASEEMNHLEESIRFIKLTLMNHQLQKSISINNSDESSSINRF